MSYTNPRDREPPDHAIGRSRGGLTCKIHLVSDGLGRPLNLIVTPANINDTTMLEPVIGGIRVAREGSGRPRTRPEAVIADKGYPSRANRVYLAGRGIRSVIPDREDQKANRKKRGAAGGRPSSLDTDLYRQRNVVERSFNRLKNWRGIATRCDKTARNYRAGVLFASTLIWLRT